MFLLTLFPSYTNLNSLASDLEPVSDSESNVDESAAQAEALLCLEDKERRERRRERRIEAIICGMEEQSSTSKKCPPTLDHQHEIHKKVRTGEGTSHKQSDLVTSGMSLFRLMGFC